MKGVTDMFTIISCIGGICALLAFIAEIVAADNFSQWPRNDEGLYSCLEPKKPKQPEPPEEQSKQVKKKFKSRQQWWKEYLECQRKLSGITSKPQPQPGTRIPASYEDCEDESMDDEEYYEEEMRREEEALMEKRRQEEEEERIAWQEEKERQEEEYYENEFRRKIEDLESRYPAYDFSYVRQGDDLSYIEGEAFLAQDYHFYDP